MKLFVIKKWDAISIWIVFMFIVCMCSAIYLSLSMMQREPSLKKTTVEHSEPLSCEQIMEKHIKEYHSGNKN